jgi:hypothetical protein
MRMDGRDAAREVLCNKPGGNGDRKRGRPQLRWYEVEEDVPWVGCRNWRPNAHSREEWRKLIAEVKSHEGM